MGMTIGMTLGSVDVPAAAAFWKEALDYDEPAALSEDGQFHVLVAPAGGLHHLTLQRVSEPKTVKNRAHLDLFVDHLEKEVERLQALGATVEIGHDGSDGDYQTIVMADPHGNEFCVVQRH